MDLNSLNAFLAVADTGSFSKAAEKIFLSQPAVSKRILALESRLNAKLFDRVGRQVHLTEAGRVLYAKSRALLHELTEVKRTLGNLNSGVGTELSFATSHHVALHRLPKPLKAFHKKYPNTRLTLSFMESEKACQTVAQGDLEMAIVTLPSRIHAPLRAEKIWGDPLKIVVARDHALARKRSISIQNLSEFPAILPGPGTATREIILQALRIDRAKLQIGMSTNYLEVLKMLTHVGLGWCALPQVMVDANLKVLEIKKVNIERALGIVTHENRTLSNAASAWQDLVRKSR
jgi:DNA-binding transcriptional LysR family regulator